MGARRRCCCECIVYWDDFNREDSTTVDGWTEVSGDWSIHDSTLEEAGTDDAIITYNQTITGSWYVAVNAKTVVSGATYRLIANYKDSSNYFHADFTFTATTGIVSLYKSGVLLQTCTFSGKHYDTLIGQDANLTLCLNTETFRAGFKNALDAETTRCIVEYGSHVLIADGNSLGLGNGSTELINYDEFEGSLEEISGADCPWCCPPLCLCERASDLVLRATFSSACAALNGPLLYFYVGGGLAGTCDDLEDWILRCGWAFVGGCLVISNPPCEPDCGCLGGDYIVLQYCPTAEYPDWHGWELGNDWPGLQENIFDFGCTENTAIWDNLDEDGHSHPTAYTASPFSVTFTGHLYYQFPEPGVCGCECTDGVEFTVTLECAYECANYCYCIWTWNGSSWDLTSNCDENPGAPVSCPYPDEWTCAAPTADGEYEGETQSSYCEPV